MVRAGQADAERLEMKLEAEVLESTVRTMQQLYGYSESDAKRNMLAYYKQTGYDVSEYVEKKNPTPAIPPEWGPVMP